MDSPNPAPLNPVPEPQWRQSPSSEIVDQSGLEELVPAPKPDPQIPEGEATRLRVILAGRFPRLLNDSLTSDPKAGISTYFDFARRYAESAPPDRRSELFGELIGCVQSEAAKPENWSRALALSESCLRAGEPALAAKSAELFERRLPELPLHELTGWVKRLAELEPSELSRKLLSASLDRIETVITGSRASFLDHQIKDYSQEGKLTPAGLERVRAFVAECPAGPGMELGLRNLMRELHAAGKFVTSREDPYVLEDGRGSHRERDYYTGISNNYRYAPDIGCAARKLADAEPQLSARCLEVGGKLYDLMIEGARGALTLRLEEWKQELRAIRYVPVEKTVDLIKAMALEIKFRGFEPDKGVMIEFKPPAQPPDPSWPKVEVDTSKGWLELGRIYSKIHAVDLFRQVQPEAMNVLWAALNDDSFFDKGVEFLRSIEPGLFEIGFYQHAAGRAAKSFEPERLNGLLESWKHALDRLSGDLANVHHIQDQSTESSPACDRFVKAVERGKGEKPAIPTETHLLCDHARAKAIAFLKSGREDLRAEGLVALLALPETAERFYNSHMDPPHEKRAFREFDAGRGAMWVRDTFTPILFKARALLEGAVESPRDAAALLGAVRGVLEKVEIDPASTRCVEQEDRIASLIGFVRELSKLDPEAAQSAYDKTHKLISAGDAYWGEKVDKYEAARPGNDDPARFTFQYTPEHYLSTSHHSALKFWKQVLEGDTRACLAASFASAGKSEPAEHLVGDLISGFRGDLDAGRERFDVNTLISAAKSLSFGRGLQSAASEAYGMALERLERLRGSQNFSGPTLDHFNSSVRSSGLAHAEKDRLLAGAIETLQPRDDAGWKAVMSNPLSFLNMVGSQEKRGEYPLAELAALALVEKLTARLGHVHGASYVNVASLGILGTVFDKVETAQPEIMRPGAFQALIGRSASESYVSSLSALFPEEARAHFEGPVARDGRFDLTRMRSGNFDFAGTLSDARCELAIVLADQELANERLAHLSEVFECLLSHELSVLRRGASRLPQLSEISAMQSFQSLAGAAGLGDAAESLPPGETRTCLRRVLLGASGADEALGKIELYRSLIGSPGADRELQALAFENFAKSRLVSTYLNQHYHDCVAGSGSEREALFMRAIRSFLGQGPIGTGSSQFAPDSLLAYALEDPAETDSFTARHDLLEGRWAVPDEEKDLIGDKRLQYCENMQEFGRLWDTLAGSGRYWVPDLTQPHDLTIVYELRFNMGGLDFGRYAEVLRRLYIVEAFDDTRDRHNTGRYTYDASAIEAEVQRYMPEFGLSAGQRVAIEALFEEKLERSIASGYWSGKPPVPRAESFKRGHMELSELEGILGGPLDLGKAEREKLEGFLKADYQERFFYETIQRTMGPARLNHEQKVALQAALDDLVVKHEQRKQLAAQRQRPALPQIFEEQAELTKYAASSYFIRLPYGEQQAVMDELGSLSAASTPAADLRRFLELVSLQKVGQFLSSRLDLLPADYCRELESFQQDLKHGSFDEVRSTIAAELGRPLEEVFASLESEPVHVGTIGEVYRGTLEDGRVVAVKVITESHRQSILGMLNRLEEVASDLDRNRDRLGLEIDPVALFKEFRKGVLRELDFRNELANADEIRGTLPAGFEIPAHHRDLATRSLLVQDFARGVGLSEVGDPALAERVVDSLGGWLADGLLRRGIFHEDLHPGNLRVIPEDGRIVLLDFGRVGRLSETQRESLLPILLAIESRNPQDLIEIFKAQSPQGAHFDRVGAESDLREGLDSPGSGATLKLARVLSALSKNGLAVDGAYLQALKALMSFEGSARKLQPEFSMEEFARGLFLRKLLNPGSGGG